MTISQFAIALAHNTPYEQMVDAALHTVDHPYQRAR